MNTKIDLSKIPIFYTTHYEYEIIGVVTVKLSVDLTPDLFSKHDYFNTGIKLAPSGTTIIVCHQDYAKHMTKNELFAVMCHEYGHILNKHVYNDTGNDQNEYEADDFAVTLVPKELFLHALVKTITYIRHRLAIDGPDTFENNKPFLKRIIDLTVKRINRLDAK